MCDRWLAAPASCRCIPERPVLQFRPRPSLAEVEAQVEAFYADARNADVYREYGRRGLHAAERDLFEKHVSAPARVLDLGCGAGREAFGLAALGHDVTAIDLAAPMIEAARELAMELVNEGKVDFRVARLSTLESDALEGANDYDCVYLASDLYQRVPSRAERVALLRRLAGALRPEGVVIVAVYIEPAPPLWRRGVSLTARAFVSAARPGSAAESGGYWFRFERPLEPVALIYKQRFTNERVVESELIEAGLTSVEKAGGFFVCRKAE